MRWAIAVDLGATNVRVALGNSEGKLLAVRSEPTKRKGAGGVIAGQIVGLASSLIREACVKRIEGVGIGTIGPLNHLRGEVVRTPNLPFKRIPLVKPISAKLKLPVRLLNDCTAAALGEYKFGAKVENLVYVALGTGIGGGAVVDGHLLLGKDLNAVEIGHLTIDPRGKLRCGCGKLGHWEAYCSGANIPRFAELWLKEKRMKNGLLPELARAGRLTAETLFGAAKAGNEQALQFIEELGKLNAIGFANLTDAYDPELIAVGGSLALKNPELVLEPIKRHIKDHAINRVPRIELSSLGADATLYGALAAAFGFR